MTLQTSITIPGISYVIDTGRQKCRNFNSATGVASFDIMWISKAAADQRAGRAGRTGPGHCYRLYSSTMYSRHMDDFALPEVLTRPLEDVVLSMKAMNISNVAGFPFPTPPENSQVEAAVKLLANIGCVELSSDADKGGDGDVTRLGAAVAKLPLGVRYGKILLVAAQAGVLDYAIAMVATLSESSPFLHNGQNNSTNEEEKGSDSDSSDEEVNAPPAKKARGRWAHRSGDVLAAMLAVGAYTFAGRGAGGAAEKLACKQFCEENQLNSEVMERIQKMRIHLARLSKSRLSNAEGIAAKTGGILSSMAPPNKLQERLLIQAVASGLLDNIAMLAPLGSIPGEHPFSLRSAYLSCSLNTKEPLFMDRNSVVYSRDSRQLPQWVCFDTLIRKTMNDGTSVAIMKSITPIDTSWLGELAKGCRLLSIGDPLATPVPSYDKGKDAIMCSVTTLFGSNGWEIPPVKAELFVALQSPGGKQSSHFMADDSFRWFARFLFEGKVLPELGSLLEMLNDSPAVITRRTPVSKVALLVSALLNAGVDSAAALRKHWAETDNKFLFKHLKNWIKADRVEDAKRLWMDAVKENIKVWRARPGNIGKTE
jgi:ATP-dependent RNA helicase DHX37/DHR1